MSEPASARVIEDWRTRIDAIDEQLMRLLNSRSACAVELGRIKRSLGLPIYSAEREAQILARVERENPGPLDALAVRRVFEARDRRESPPGAARDGERHRNGFD